MKETPKNSRRIMAILAVIVGLFMVAGAPFIIQVSMERVVAALIEVAKDRPAFSSGIMLFSFLYPFYRGLIFIGGIILVLISVQIYKGEEWAFPVGLLASAFPSAGGMFMFLPYVSWVDGFPLPMIISFVGLAFFWSIIFLRKVDKWQKLAHFLVLTFAGMLTTHAFTIGVGNFRMLLTRPNKPLYDGMEWWVLSWSAPVQWICVVLLFVGLYLMAARKQAGWWFILISAVSILTIDIPTQIIRSTMSESTSLDYLYGALLSAGLLFGLLFPKFKAALFGQVALSQPEQLPEVDSASLSFPQAR